MVQRLRQTRTPIEADLLISRLRAAGLHPSELRVWPHVTLAGGDLFYDVDVPEEEVESARQIMGAVDSEQQTPLANYSFGMTNKLAIAILLAAIVLGVVIP